MIRVIDWFSGIGGFRLGLEMAGGFEIVAHSEIDDYAEKIYQRHWPGSRNLGDIREVRDVPEADLWCGGFPCQPFSVAGARRGDADERNLWPVWFDLICAYRPRYILGENVPGLLADRQFGRILADLSAAGYVSEWTVIGARDVGAPHRRDRLWIWAYLAHGDERGREVERRGAVDHGPRRGNADRCGRAGGEGEVADPGRQLPQGEREARATPGPVGRGGLPWPPGWTLDPADVAQPEVGTIWPGLREGGPAGERGGRHGNGGCPYCGADQGPASPLLGRVAHGIPHRTHRLRCLGNAVVPQVVAWIGERIRGAVA